MGTNWKRYLKSFAPMILLLSLALLTLPQLRQAWVSFTHPPRYLVSCRNHSTFVQTYLGWHVFRHGALPYEANKAGEEVFCQVDFNGMGQNCHHGAPNQAHGGWQLVNVPEAVWDKILQAMPDEKVPVLWCGRTHKSAQGDKRIVLYIDNAKPWRISDTPYASFRAFREAEVTEERSPWAFDIAYGMPESELAAKLARVNSVLEAAGLPGTPIDVEGRPSYWNLAAPFQNVPQARPKSSP